MLNSRLLYSKITQAAELASAGSCRPQGSNCRIAAPTPCRRCFPCRYLGWISKSSCPDDSAFAHLRGWFQSTWKPAASALSFTVVQPVASRSRAPPLEVSRLHLLTHQRTFVTGTRPPGAPLYDVSHTGIDFRSEPSWPFCIIKSERDFLHVFLFDNKYFVSGSWRYIYYFSLKYKFKPRLDYLKKDWTGEDFHTLLTNQKATYSLTYSRLRMQDFYTN